jgi:exopolysaccharide biosynthesis polyprenyl glycosylphosphotransferase
MVSQNLSVDDYSSDLRSAKGRRITKSLTIPFLRIITLLITDIISLTLAWKLGISQGTPLESPWTTNTSFFLLTLAIQLGIFTSKKLYQAGDYRRNYLSLIKAISLSNLLLLVIAFFYEPNQYLSRSAFLLFWLCSITFLCLTRWIFDISTQYLRHKGAIRHPAFLITDKNDEEQSISLIEKESRYNLLGVASAKSLDKANRAETLQYLKQLGIVELFISWHAIKNRLYICWHFQTAGITLRILPTDKQVMPANSQVWMIGKVPSITIPVPLIIGADFLLKRCFDLCASIFLLIFLSPIYLLISLVIKLDSPGPIFFRQSRVGLHGKNFKIWKFRTMVTNAEKLQESLEAKNEIKDGVLFKIKDDPRITGCGKFLRQYSLDELPQIFNVIVGEMSLVGPRPLPLRDVEKFKRNYFIRQDVLPGITGLWQVSGRSNIEDFEDGVKLDISYIENWSLWLDFKILLQTVLVVLFKKGAY